MAGLRREKTMGLWRGMDGVTSSSLEDWCHEVLAAIEDYEFLGGPICMGYDIILVWHS